jgi:hypothetical protein
LVITSPSLTSFKKSAPSVVYPKHAYAPSSKFFPAGVRSESKSSQNHCDDALGPAPQN